MNAMLTEQSFLRALAVGVLIGAMLGTLATLVLVLHAHERRTRRRGS